MSTHLSLSSQKPSPAGSDRQQEVKFLRKLAATALQQDNIQKAHLLLCKAKSLKTPLESIDYLRAMVFAKKHDPASAREALREELRYFPDNEAAHRLLDEINNILVRPGMEDEEFQGLYNSVRAYTMVAVPRLYSLFLHAKEVCIQGPAGNFVECGVAGGGSSGLLSTVISRYAPSRSLFSCDSFEGMPPSTEFDVHNGQSAEDSGWGAGTCAAPESSVQDLCRLLGTDSVLTTVKGYFEDTLPVWKDLFGPIAFLHMDGDWYTSTRTILENLYDKLVPGAYVQVDDFSHWDGCRKAVTEFFCNESLQPDIYAIDEAGVWFRKPVSG